jgi:pimeloyl-ACP methyl ester carboxylesterase
MRALLLAPALVLLVGCATPITAKDVGPDRVRASVSRNVLDSRRPSISTATALHRASLTELWDDEPREALTAMHRAALQIDGRDRVFALAEMCYLTARRERDPELYVAAAVYSYLFLVGDLNQEHANRFDRRLGLAVDLYNRSLAEAFRSDDGELFDPRMGTVDMPVGSVEIVAADQVMRLGHQVFTEFRPAIDYQVKGMTSRIITPGIGAALIAGLPPGVETSAGDVSAGARIGGTAFLDVEGELADMESGAVRLRLSLHNAIDEHSIDVRGRTVPLESDITVPIAYSLRESKMWDFELSGFLSPDKAAFENGLQLVEPYQPGKIPVVFVHGTASSPARWAEMLNELRADDTIEGSYQYWLFIYQTSAPILRSAASLRDSLNEKLAALDPEGKDEALKKMVIVGHSQGGLLTRLMVTESGNHFWEHISDLPPEELDLTPEEIADIRSVGFFDPLPFVERVVFIATPHQGSFLSEGILRSLANMLITLPKKTMARTKDIIARNTALLKHDVLAGQPTAVDNMAPGNPFLVALGRAPMSPRVHKHSIVAVEGDGPLEEEDDGVVAYTSAHLPGVESELVVHSYHSCQDKAPAIAEMRRILREALGETGKHEREHEHETRPAKTPATSK